MQCSTSILLPAYTFLVLKNVIVKAKAPFTGKALVAANSAHYSGVLSYGNNQGSFDCTGVNAAAIRVFNSSFFQIDGLNIDKCGAFQSMGSIDIVGTGNTKVGNSTEVAGN